MRVEFVKWFSTLLREVRRWTRNPLLGCALPLKIRSHLHHEQDDFEQYDLSPANLPGLPNSISCVCPHPSLSFLLLYFLCCLKVLSGYCNVSVYFLGILGVTKLQNFA